MRLRTIARTSALCLALGACSSIETPVTPQDSAVTDRGEAQDLAVDISVDARSPDVADASADVSADRASVTDVSSDRASVTDRPSDRASGTDVSTDSATDVRSTGAICGTRGAPPCAAGQFCDFPIDAICGAADAPGRCAQRPGVCTDDLNPVCGCDGRTYSNPCAAASNGASVARRGACATDAGAADAMSDCRSHGCSGTDTCHLCLGPKGVTYVCIPAGVEC